MPVPAARKSPLAQPVWGSDGRVEPRRRLPMRRGSGVERGGGAAVGREVSEASGQI